MSDSLNAKYHMELLMHFTLDIENKEYMLPNTFTGSDAEQYHLCYKIFHGKNWNEINLDLYINEVIDFHYLTDMGFRYYLPGFLKYFFQLENTHMSYYHWLIEYLHSNRKNYDKFSDLTPEQSKLIAMFLVNAANLDGYDPRAQNALTCYWGNFLLF